MRKREEKEGGKRCAALRNHFIAADATARCREESRERKRKVTWFDFIFFFLIMTRSCGARERAGEKCIHFPGLMSVKKGVNSLSHEIELDKTFKIRGYNI